MQLSVTYGQIEPSAPRTSPSIEESLVGSADRSVGWATSGRQAGQLSPQASPAVGQHGTVCEGDLLIGGDGAEGADDEHVVGRVLDVLGDGLVRVVVQAAQAEGDRAVPIPVEVVLVNQGRVDVLALGRRKAQHRAYLDDLTGGDGHGGEHPPPMQCRRGDVRPAGDHHATSTQAPSTARRMPARSSASTECSRTSTPVSSMNGVASARWSTTSSARGIAATRRRNSALAARTSATTASTASRGTWTAIRDGSLVTTSASGLVQVARTRPRRSHRTACSYSTGARMTWHSPC